MKLKYDYGDKILLIQPVIGYKLFSKLNRFGTAISSNNLHTFVVKVEFYVIKFVGQKNKIAFNVQTTFLLCSISGKFIMYRTSYQLLLVSSVTFSLFCFNLDEKPFLAHSESHCR